MSLQNRPYEDLPGTPSDAAPEILDTGHGDVSMSARHIEGRDAEYLRWHTLDHRPEQHRLAGVQSSLRIVSTPDCRAARASSGTELDATDHVMTYFFNDMTGLEGFNDLAVALNKSGRMQFHLPSVQQGVYRVEEKLATPRIQVGGDVLPWWPAMGVYLLVEAGDQTPGRFDDVPGVAGVWRGSSQSTPYSNADNGQHITYLFLDGDPLEVAERIQPILQRRWESSRIRPLLAAPFHTLVAYEWEGAVSWMATRLWLTEFAPDQGMRHAARFCHSAKAAERRAL